MMNGDAETIIAHHVKLGYGRDTTQAVVLDDVSLAVYRGEVAVVGGRNGIGKSSLLKVLAGTIAPIAGDVRIFGKPPRQAKIGIVWQNSYASLYPWLTALENAALPLRLRGVGRRERDRRVNQICAELGFDIPLDRRPQELSGGEQQKVAIVRALAADCELLLMDEPFSSLSFDSTIDLLLHIRHLHERTNVTTIMVNHLPEFSVFVADVVIPLHQKPVCLKETDRIRVRPPRCGSRSRNWMFDEDFRNQVEEIKCSLGVVQ